ncbi:MAG TPA: hypothetical protein PKW95_01325 [bacterium]|nr:hypothetical protein [bacterium]
MAIETYLDALQEYADEAFHTELLAARVEYFAGLGRVSENEASFEAHLDRFLDWFLFERVLPQSGLTPMQSFLRMRSEKLPPEECEVYEGFGKNIHSLFLVKKIDKHGVHVRDLLTKAKYYVSDELPSVFTKGQVFEARLLPYREGWRFSKGYIFHPLSVAKQIVKRVKSLTVDDEEGYRSLIRDLAIRRLKADRYKHIDAMEFYRF